DYVLLLLAALVFLSSPRAPPEMATQYEHHVSSTGSTRRDRINTTIEINIFVCCNNWAVRDSSSSSSSPRVI
ncbi:hypothetical protein EDD18DRAFT_1203459, partial [Armillaria luteobubalina]